ncbi:hypothetical protein AAJV73_15480 [Cyanobium sp. BSA11S]|uniref:hypothetical protein n=1 Tax=Synechococcales TaxID=1890424 RepID=UPI001C8A0C1F|nr:hypothetical protein [Synechococcus sp. BSF8S]
MAFDQAWDAVDARVSTTGSSPRLFGVAWHGFGYRVTTVTEYAQRYRMQQPYGCAGHDGNFRNDQALVDYLFNACSALDCLVIAAYAIASDLKPQEFPSDSVQLRRVTRRVLATRFQTHWPGANLTEVLVKVYEDSKISRLFAIRDVVTHRGTLPRTLYAGGDRHGKVTVPSNVKDPPDVWESDLELGDASVADWQATLEPLFERAVVAVIGFTSSSPNGEQGDA